MSTCFHCGEQSDTCVAGYDSLLVCECCRDEAVRLKQVERARVDAILDEHEREWDLRRATYSEGCLFAKQAQ